jgi:hypothetical protein
MEGGKAVRAQELTQDLTQGVVPPGTPNLNIASFGEDRFGEMYLVNYGGEIFRLEQE